MEHKTENESNIQNPAPSTSETATSVSCRMTTEVQPCSTIITEPIPIDPYTTEEDDSDFSKIEISSTSTYHKCKEMKVMCASKNIVEGHSQRLGSNHEFTVVLPSMPKHLKTKVHTKPPVQSDVKMPSKLQQERESINKEAKNKSIAPIPQGIIDMLNTSEWL